MGVFDFARQTLVTLSWWKPHRELSLSRWNRKRVHLEFWMTPVAGVCLKGGKLFNVVAARSEAKDRK